MTNKEYWFWLINIPGFGNRRIKLLLEHYKTPKDLYYIEEKDLKAILKLREKDIISWNKSKANISETLEKLHKLDSTNTKIRFITMEDEEYPIRLKEIYDPPYGLYLKGNQFNNNLRNVAIVGARDCTGYGKEISRQISRLLSENNVTVVSGMAYGIDCAAHTGAIEGKGNTAAVLGGGVDVIYPKENIFLYENIQNNGTIISESPIGTIPEPFRFPIRNRIISGICDCTIVIEARKKSGSLITVDQALEQGREIFAVPGRINDPLSLGCNNLIKMGANIVTSVDDILNFLNIKTLSNQKSPSNIKETNQKMLEGEELLIYQYLELEPKHLGDILEFTNLPVNQAICALLRLELKNYIIQPMKNYYSLKL